jgi:hypothetical protein
MTQVPDELNLFFEDIRPKSDKRKTCLSAKIAFIIIRMDDV